MFLKHATIRFLKILVITVCCNFDSAIASDLAKLELKMGKLEKLDSKVLKQKRSLFVRLPDNYEKSTKHYPVLYLLDANSFYIGNIYQEAVTLVSRLEKINDIPELIIVSIQSEQWYKDVITDSTLFESYINQEVVSYIESQYRTLPQRILMGHSYAGAFVSGAIPIDARNFDLLLAVSPVYPSMVYIDKIRNRYSKLKQHNAKLVIIDGDESPMDKLILKQAANNLSSNALDFNYLSKKLDGHMSVLTIGLSHALREHFNDYRFPSRELVAKNIFDMDKLKTYYDNRDKKYGSKTDKAKLKSLAIAMAHRYTSMGKLEQAFPFWRIGESKFKEYFMIGYADRFIALGKRELALELLQEIKTLFPNSDKNHQQKIDKLVKELTPSIV